MRARTPPAQPAAAQASSPLPSCQPGSAEVRDPRLGMVVRVPTPPPLLEELHRMLDDPRAGMDDIAALLQKDAGLTASLFRTLAKPVYGLRRPPETVAQAMSIVGLKTVAELACGLSIQSAIYGESPFYAWFWERANEIANYAATIARRQRAVCNVFPEHAQLAGLFVDCGVPILVQHIERYVWPFTTAEGYIWPDLVEEDRKFNTDHAVVGYFCARHWHMPDYVCQAIRWQHEPINVENKAATLIAILQVATHIYNVYAMKEDHGWEDHRSRALEEIGVAAEALKEFEEEIYDRANGR